MAGTVPLITSNPNNITGMGCLENRPVFFLNLNGSPNVSVVVKGEGDGEHPLAAHATASIKWGAKLMKHVNNRYVNTKIMTADEIIGFKAAALQLIPGDKIRPLANVATPGPPYTWTKMPFVPGVTTAEFYNEKLGAWDPNDAKSNIVKMLDNGFWVDLGKVVAVDIFNGNCDRFDVTNGNWINKGNIMYLAGGATSVIGLDTFDPNARELSDLESHINFADNIMRTKFEFLRVLVDGGKRLQFARKCLKSTGKCLQKAFTSMDHVTVAVPRQGAVQIVRIVVKEMGDLFEDYSEGLNQGLTEGATALKQQLQAKVRQYRPAVQWQQGWGFNLPGQGGGVPHAPVQRGLAPRLRNPGGVVPPVQPPVIIPGRVIPQGVLDRMEFLKWSVV